VLKKNLKNPVNPVKKFLLKIESIPSYLGYLTKERRIHGRQTAK
jgi:hypothetical protein